jgi:hypothetical protein
MRAIRPAAAANGAAIVSTRSPCEARYVYCIYRSRFSRIFSGPGIGGRDYPVYAINYGDLAAAVSASPQGRYQSTRRNMTTHMRVQEEVMRDHAILPVQFNTIAPDIESVITRLLAPAYQELNAQLDEIAGGVEIGVKAFWRPNVVFSEIAAENTDIRLLRDCLAGRDPLESYSDRVRLGEMVGRALRFKRQRESAEILARLRPCAERLRVSEPFSERMALNAAAFVKSEQLPDFERRLAALEEDRRGRMAFKCVGPAPPYNFVELTLG